MSDFLIAPVARAELDEIWEYYAIELQNPDAADRIRDEIFASFHTLAQALGMGHFRGELASPSGPSRVSMISICHANVTQNPFRCHAERL